MEKFATPAVREATLALEEAQLQELRALQNLEMARVAEESARKAGDPAKLEDAQQALTNAVAQEREQHELTRLREAAVVKARSEQGKSGEASAEKPANQLAKAC